MENLLLGNVIESGNISPFSCPFCGNVDIRRQPYATMVHWI